MAIPNKKECLEGGPKFQLLTHLANLAEMDSAYYGDYAAFLHIQETISRFSVGVFTGAKKKDGQTAEMARESAISQWLAVFGGAWNYFGG